MKQAARRDTLPPGIVKNNKGFSMDTTPGHLPSDQPLDLVRRPAGQLHDFPVEVRWEVTRRHPYYLSLWEEVKRYRRGQPDDPPERKMFGYAATLVLGAIGVTGEPVSPVTPFSELIGAGGDPAFLGGSVRPMSLRSVVAMMLTALPPAERAFVGSLLLNSGMEEHHKDADPAMRSAELDMLARTPSPALDSYPDAPLFYVHLGASQRAIVRDTEDQVRRWKARRGGESSKVHTAKLTEYLWVWDLREGWADGGYDHSRELPFVAVAAKLKQPLSTVVSQYRSAFEFVVGHPFVPELWWRVFGPLKYSRLFGDAKAAYSACARHRLRSPIARPVPDSVVSPVTDTTRTGTTVERGSAVTNDMRFTDMLIDLSDLIARGLPDEEIARRLDLDDPELVTNFRRHSEELRDVSR